MSIRYHEIITINDINDREEILETLANVYTDEDFCGNNGEEFTWADALENGFKSSQEYLVDLLRKDTLQLKGVRLIEEFFNRWFGSDGYYEYYEYESDMIDDKKCVFSVCASGEC